MRYLSFAFQAVALGLLAYPTYWWVTHPDTTSMRMLFEFWHFYVPALVVALVGLYILGGRK